WHGGNMRNAIPFEAEAVITLPKENKEDLLAIAADYKETFNDEYKGIENDIEVIVEDVELPSSVVPQEIQDNIVDAIYAAHNGVWRYIPSIPNIVETSSNLAIVDIENGKASVKILARSSSETVKDELATSLESCFNMAGMKVTLSGEYGGWNPNTESEIVKTMRGIYKELFNAEPKVQVVHAGLECSIILSKYPDLDICSFGPTLRSPHTPNERALWPSVAKFWALLTRTLAEIK
ncbi:MAG: cytosol nonspecific dipeptidase, partial [Prevotella sp.]